MVEGLLNIGASTLLRTAVLFVLLFGLCSSDRFTSRMDVSTVHSIILRESVSTVVLFYGRVRLGYYHTRYYVTSSTIRRFNHCACPSGT